MSGGAEAGGMSGILEASPGAIAVLIVFFLLVTLGFEKGLHVLRHSLQKRKKLGLLAAVNNLSSELMLLAVASIILTALEPALTKICVKSDYTMKPWLTHVNDCACCLAKTEGVSACFLQSRQCPADMHQQCGVHEGPHRAFRKSTVKYAPKANTTDAHNATAAVATPSPKLLAGQVTTAAVHTADAIQGSTSEKSSTTRASTGQTGRRRRRLAAVITDASNAVSQPATSAGDAEAAGAAQPPQQDVAVAAGAPDHAADAEELVCRGIHQETYEACGFEPGLAPVFTEDTLEHVHMLLFIMAVVHIIISVIVLLLSTFKLKLWQIMGGKADEDLLAAAALAAATATAYSTDSTVPKQPQPLLETAPLDTVAGPAAVPVVAAAPVATTAANDDTKPADQLTGTATPPPPAAAAPAAAAAAPAAAAAGGAVGRDVPGLSEPHESAAAAVLVVEAATADVTTTAADVALSVPNWRGRPTDIVAAAGWFKECGEALLRQLLVLVHPTLTKQEYSVLRASFYLTHMHMQAMPATPSVGDKATEAAADASSTHVTYNTSAKESVVAAAGAAAASVKEAPAAAPARGVYAPYLLEQIERDGSKAVGLGLPMWILVLCFVLLSGAIGWATWLFLILAGGLLLVINSVLITTARYITRGGSVKKLVPCGSRWLVLHNDRMLLGAIKLLLFFLSFVISNSVYFAAFFGPGSCFFSRTGFQKNPIPWWGVMLVDLYLLLTLGLFTLPLYTVTTHTLKADQRLLGDIQQRQQRGAGHEAVQHSDDNEAWE